MTVWWATGWCVHGEWSPRLVRHLRRVFAYFERNREAFDTPEASRRRRRAAYASKLAEIPNPGSDSDTFKLVRELSSGVQVPVAAVEGFPRAVSGGSYGHIRVRYGVYGCVACG